MRKVYLAEISSVACYVRNEVSPNQSYCLSHQTTHPQKEEKFFTDTIYVHHIMLCTTINEGIKKRHPISPTGRPMKGSWGDTLLWQHTIWKTCLQNHTRDTQWCKLGSFCTYSSVQQKGEKKRKCTLLWQTVQIRRHWPSVKHMHTLSRRWQCKLVRQCFFGA